MPCDDDHDHDSGLGGAVWFQMGRWAEQDAQQTRRILHNLGNAFSFRPAETVVFTHELNALIAQRDALQQQMRQQAEKSHRDADFVISLLEDKHAQIDQLEYENKFLSDNLKAERERHSTTTKVKNFMTSRWFHMIKYVEHGLFNEPEFRELVQLTKEFYARYSPARDTLFESTERYQRVNALTEVLDQKCKE
jgi:GTPase Era involved in 16S rRNA processing